MLDGNGTTIDWQTSTTDVLVLPVGAFEQHGAHLPLATDAIEADFFGRMIAEALGAALLPALRIATSMEHTGFRGSFSLRPETLMQVIRDLADEAARQNFRIVVVANFHGGNHCLTPVCRDLNRRDGPVKLLLVDVWEFADPAFDSTHGRPGLNLHAAELETSLMLAIAPEWVRGPVADAVAQTDTIPLTQKELTTFGVGHLNPHGVVGWPSGASREKGEALIASIRQRLVPVLQDRITRLRAQWRYAGAGGLTLRPMAGSDLPELLALKTAAQWNQVPADWRLFLETQPAGCFVMAHQGRAVGSAASIAYAQRLAWIGMVLVDPAFRRLGIATALMERTLAALTGCPTVGLDATPAGQTVYEKLGFRAAGQLWRMVAPAAARPPAPDDVAPLTPTDLPEIAALDQATFGVDRTALLGWLLARKPEYGYRLPAQGAIRGFCLGRDGANYEQIGPIVAATPADAARLASAALAAIGARPAVIDAWATQPEFLAHLRSGGFAPQRNFVRMYRGAPPPAGDPARAFACAGPELG
ncbi:MAG: GNAT family N-acetyltransferase [Opitutae bacterium]|nr:GNAT family N-acetyltransferase [Opitutae bacterium]